MAQDGLGMGARRVTVSTAGIAKMIRKLADDGARFNLALSLHAANDEKRDKIMPINEQNSLADLKDALRYYTRVTRKEVTFEYILLNAASTIRWPMRRNWCATPAMYTPR
jgi:23S rRNA (adenine2503-C2)-methyltransferase